MPLASYLHKHFVQRIFPAFKRKPKCFPFQSLPTELQLHCFSFMTLQSIIGSCAVCSDWRRLVPLTDIYSPRRRLYDLYRVMLDNPKPDGKSLSYLQKKVDPSFDREGYINSLLRQGHAVPEEFRIWVLEWPARLFIDGIWPGLPLTECYLDTTATGGSSRKYGVNWLAQEAPELSTAIIEHRGPNFSKRMPSLLIWTSCWVENKFLGSGSQIFRIPYRGHEQDMNLWDCDTWLVFDEESPYFGKVVEFSYHDFASPGEMPHEFQGSIEDKLPDWVQYLELRWHGSAPGSRPSSGTVIPSIIVDVPITRIEIVQDVVQYKRSESEWELWHG